MTAAEEEDFSPLRKWIIAITVMFGAFLAVMDISVVNVALPHMMGTFGQDLSSITWVATSYSIAEIILLTMAGWLTMLLGRKRLYLLSFAVFTISSMLCGTARSFQMILLYRVIQGIGGGSLIPLSQAILRETFPLRQQGMAMAVYSMGVVLAPAIGPIVGGWLTDHYGWPWIFYINVPFAIVGMMLVATYVHDPPYLRRGVRKIDWIGIALLTVALTTLQVVLERGQEKNWFQSNLIVAMAIACALSTLAMVFWEMYVPEPVINFRLLRRGTLPVGAVAVMIFGVALYGTTFILPQYTQDLLGYPAFEAGMVLAPRGLTLLVMMPVVGWLYPRVDARLMVAVGTALIFWSYYDLSHLSLTAGFWNLVPMLVIMGVGMPFMFVTLSTLSLSTVPRPDMTEASSLYTLAQRIGGNVGYALVAVLLERGVQTHRTMMAAHVSAYDPRYLEYQHQVIAQLKAVGVTHALRPQVALGLVDHVLNAQATMQGYNDVSWVLGLMFFAVIPLIILLPAGRAGGNAKAAATRR